MPQENPDIEQMAEDASSADETEISGRDRTRGKTIYTRKAIVKIFRMTKKQVAEFEAKGEMTGFEEAAVALRKRSIQEKGTGNSALALVRDTLGEQVFKQKEIGEKGGPSVQIEDDLPRAVRGKQVN